MNKFYPLSLNIMLFPLMAYSAEIVKDLPPEVLPFVTAEEQVIAYLSEDLNGDNLKEVIIVLQKSNPDQTDNARTLLLLQRQPNGELKLASRNVKAVLCEECGGVFGDPFEGIMPRGKGFSILHYGGSNFRWRQDYHFGWSKRDKTWQLVEVNTVNYHTSDPDTIEEKQYRPPHDFGLINLVDFDIDNWEGNGKR